METFIAQSKTQKLPSVRHSIDRHLYSSQPGRSGGKMSGLSPERVLALSSPG